ncbi:MAG TPA: ATP-grasp domain-containing protein [Paraburkholderia sp.]
MKSHHPKRIVIVDGYSTGRELVRELNSRGVSCLHLQSSAQIPALAAKCFDVSPYERDLGYLGPVNEAVAALATVQPDAVVAGSEWGVTFAEFVAQCLDLPTNRIETISARRNKFDMIEALRVRGLRVADQAPVNSAQEAHIWAVLHGKWPVVVKPALSAGSDGVVICNDHADIDHAFEQALYRENLMGCFNDHLVIQSYLSGPQFIVNTVSHGGRHCVTDAWHVDYRTVPGGSIAAGSMTLLDPAHPVSRELMAYTLAAVSALGIENGAAHSELRMTPQGPALIEAGARLMGGMMDPESYRAAGLPTQASRYADTLTMGADEIDVLFGHGIYARRRHLAKLFFVFESAGEVSSAAGLAKLKTLPSFHAHYRGLAKGGQVWRTSDSLFCGGVVYLVHDDPAQIAADIQQFRAWDAAGRLYAVMPAIKEESLMS